MNKLTAPALAIALLSTGCEPEKSHAWTQETQDKTEAAIGSYAGVEETLKKLHQEILTTELKTNKVFPVPLWVGSKKVFVEVQFDENLGRWISELDVARSENISANQTDKVLDILMKVDVETNKAWINRGN